MQYISRPIFKLVPIKDGFKAKIMCRRVGAGRSGFVFQFRHVLTVQSWGGFIVSLTLDFLFPILLEKIRTTLDK